MIRIDFAPDNLPLEKKAEWDNWILRARAATDRVIAQWEQWKRDFARWKNEHAGGNNQPAVAAPEFDPAWDDEVWRGFRDWLLENVFNNKCAYCETTIVGFIGDAEHFRPKGRVRVKLKDGSSKIVRIMDEDGNEIAHPGYFWLAYHWQNLLPSCHLCNRYGGKKDLFPVAGSHVAVKRLTVDEIDRLIYRITRSPSGDNIFYLEPKDLDLLEDRLLLHPYYDNPEKHLYFRVDGKAAAWRGSQKAEASIEVYDLNESVKVDARRRMQRKALKRYFTLLAATRDDDENWEEARRAAQQLKDEYYRGTEPYAAAVFDYIHDKLKGSAYDPEFLLGERR